MIRKLLATTAIASVIATGAYAQSDDAATSGQGSTGGMQTEGSQGAADDAVQAQSDEEQSASDVQYLETLSDDQYVETDIVGQSLYDGEGEDAQSLGEISNLLVDQDGSVAAVVVDATVADQSKTIALAFDQIDWTMTEDGTLRAVMSTGADQLASAPTFMTPDAEAQQAQQQETEQSSADAGGSATGGDAATGGSATGGDAAMGGSATGDSAMGGSTGGDSAMGGSATGESASGGTSDMATDGGSSDMAAGSATSDEAADSASDDMAASGGSGGDMAAPGEDVPTSVGPDQYLTQDIVGSDVYSGPGEDAESVGSISDLVISSEGQIDAGIIGVGGFLGIGQKDVGVPFDLLEFTAPPAAAAGTGEEATATADAGPRVVLVTTQEELDQAPAFTAEEPAGDAATGDAATSGSATGGESGDAMGGSTGGSASGGSATGGSTN